jgi:hypothetical protein
MDAGARLHKDFVLRGQLFDGFGSCSDTRLARPRFGRYTNSHDASV